MWWTLHYPTQLRGLALPVSLGLLGSSRTSLLRRLGYMIITSITRPVERIGLSSTIHPPVISSIASVPANCTIQPPRLAAQVWVVARADEQSRESPRMIEIDAQVRCLCEFPCGRGRGTPRSREQTSCMCTKKKRPLGFETRQIPSGYAFRIQFGLYSLEKQLEHHHSFAQAVMSRALFFVHTLDYG